MIKDNFKLFVKELIGKTINVSNITKNIIRDKFYIFCYHEVTDNPSIFQKKNKLFVSKNVFKKQINFLNQLFTIIDPDKLKFARNNENSALITFDDGYYNSFNEALNFLNKLEIKPLFFLNMSSIKDLVPLLPASIEYLKSNNNKFNNYIKKYKINEPVSLHIKPSQFINFENFIKLNNNQINIYQGKMVSFDFLKKKQKNNTFFIADHLYEHYNCLALNKNELTRLTKKNYEILKKFKNYINFFSFPNGVPNICFNKSNVYLIKKLKYKKAFSSGNSANLSSKKFLLDRINLNNDDDTLNKILLKIYRSTKIYK